MSVEKMSKVIVKNQFYISRKTPAVFKLMFFFSWLLQHGYLFWHCWEWFATFLNSPKCTFGNLIFLWYVHTQTLYVIILSTVILEIYIFLQKEILSHWRFYRNHRLSLSHFNLAVQLLNYEKSLYCYCLTA